MSLLFHYCLLLTSILLVQALALSPHFPSSEHLSNLPSLQNEQVDPQTHKEALAKDTAPTHTHYPKIFSSFNLYHYHHSPTRKRSPSQAITCPSILINWTHDFSHCERTRSPQAFVVQCKLAYGPGPHQYFRQLIHQHCADNEICVNTKRNRQAHCVPFANFAQKSFEKLVGVVTNPTAGVVLSVAEAVLTGKSIDEGMVGRTLSLKVLRADQEGAATLRVSSSECEDCGSLAMEDIPPGTTGLEARASVAESSSGNLFVITEV
ncbi:hypothetical protein MMC11_001260 [Xylographa trunciseda]|nr:hypothetical protein [Xylographa trunciseda]